MMSRLLYTLILAASLATHAQSSAQETERPSEETVTAAQESAMERHQLGAAALLEARFAQARDFFREAMNLAPNGGSAYNLALALRGTGESTEAIALFEQLLDGEFGPVGDTQAEDMRRWIVEERGALATVEVNVEGPAEAALRVDGRGVGTATLGEPLTLHLDAGRRTLMAEADGFRISEEVIFAERASQTRLTLSLVASAQERRIFEKPAFWVVVGLVVVAGIAAGVVAALGPYESAPESSEPFGVATALSAGGL
ncbi:MAG: hypothetical protein AB8H86_33040 [Polyangiales bacterium]